MGPSVGDFLEPWNVGFQHMCHGQKSRLLGMVIPPLIGNPYIFQPLRNWVDEFIPYYMKIMGVDRPWP